MGTCDSQVSGFCFWLQETPPLGSPIPFQYDNAIFCSAHLIFPVSSHINFQSLQTSPLPPGICSAHIAEGFPGNKCPAKWKCGWCPAVSPSPKQQLCACSSVYKGTEGWVPNCSYEFQRLCCWELNMGEAYSRLFLPAGQVSHLAIWRLVISCSVETGWTWPRGSARSPLSHLCGLAGWILSSAWFHLGARCGLLLTIWLCKMMPSEHDRDKITPGLYLVWFVCKILKACYRIFVLYEIEASLEVVSFLWFANRIIFSL